MFLYILIIHTYFSKMEYENLLHDYVGEYGPYQWMIFTIASLDSFTYALYTLMPVFIAYTQPHWCSTPLDTFSNCSLSERMNFSIPQTCDGKTCVYSSCTMYVRNYSTIQVGLGLEDTCPLETNTLWNSTVEPCKTWTYGDSFYDDSAISEVRENTFYTRTIKGNIPHRLWPYACCLLPQTPVKTQASPIL